MDAHIGVDAHSGWVHTVAGTPANMSDLNMAGAWLHGHELDAFVDARYQGATSATRPASRRRLERTNLRMLRAPVPSRRGGVVEEHMDRAELLRGLLDHSLNAGRQRDVRLDGIGRVRILLTQRENAVWGVVLRSTIVHLPPWAEKASATARPMPPPAQVNSARFPESPPASAT